MRLEVHPFQTVEAARSWARGQIDASAGQARARYITVTAGQDATYQAKYADAQAFARAGYPTDQVAQYPWVQKEAEATGLTPQGAADEIKSVGDPWNTVLGPQIEGLRMGGKNKLPNLTSVGDIVTHTRKVQEQLNSV